MYSPLGSVPRASSLGWASCSSLLVSADELAAAFCFSSSGCTFKLLTVKLVLIYLGSSHFWSFSLVLRQTVPQAMNDKDGVLVYHGSG